MHTTHSLVCIWLAYPVFILDNSQSLEVLDQVSQVIVDLTHDTAFQQK